MYVGMYRYMYIHLPILMYTVIFFIILYASQSQAGNSMMY